MSSSAPLLFCLLVFVALIATLLSLAAQFDTQKQHPPIDTPHVQESIDHRLLSATATITATATATAIVSEDLFTVVIDATKNAERQATMQLAQYYAQNKYSDSVVILWDITRSAAPNPRDFDVATKRIEIVPISTAEHFLWSRKYRVRTESLFWTTPAVRVHANSLIDAFAVWRANRNSLIGFLPGIHSLDKERYVSSLADEAQPTFSFLYPPLFLAAQKMDKLRELRTRIAATQTMEHCRDCFPYDMNALHHSDSRHDILFVRGDLIFWGPHDSSFANSAESLSNYVAEWDKGFSDCVSRLLPTMALPPPTTGPFGEIKYQRHVGMHEHLNPEPAHRYAYATLISTAGYKDAAVAWAKFMKATNTTHPLILLCFKDVVREILKEPAITKYYDHVLGIDEIKNPYGVNGFSKIHCWGLLDFHKILFVDVDVVIISNMDELFVRPQLAASPDCSLSDKFNSGLIVIIPSLTFQQDILSNVFVLPSYNGGDQGFLNAYFHTWYNSSERHRIPYRYNTILYFPKYYGHPHWLNDREATACSRLALKGFPKMVHFANPWFKPWLKSGKSNPNSWQNMWWKVLDHPGIPTDLQALVPSSFTATDSDKLAGCNVVRKSPAQRTQLLEAAKASQLRHYKTCFSKQTAALVTFIDGTHANNELLPAIVWAVAANDAATKMTKVLLIGPRTDGQDWDNEQLELVGQYFDEIILVSDVESPFVWGQQNTFPDQQSNDYLARSFNMLHAWRLVQYQRVVFVDILVQLVRNIDHVAEVYHPFAAAPHVIPPDHFSANLMLLEPSQQTFLDLVRSLYTHEHAVHEGSVEAFLNRYYDGWFEHTASHRLPTNYRAENWFKHQLDKYAPYYTLQSTFQQRPWIWSFPLNRIRISVDLWCARYRSLPQAIRKGFVKPPVCIESTFIRVREFMVHPRY